MGVTCIILFLFLMMTASNNADVFAQGGAKQLHLEVEHLSQESIHCAHNSALKGVHLLHLLS